MNALSSADHEIINLGVCIKQQAEKLGIEHDGVPLSGVVARIAKVAGRAAPEMKPEPRPETLETSMNRILFTYDQLPHYGVKEAAEDLRRLQPINQPQELGTVVAAVEKALSCNKEGLDGFPAGCNTHETLLTEDGFCSLAADAADAAWKTMRHR